jgi:hypothetical protein
LIFCAVVALAFLIFTLTHLKTLKIGLFHPRVGVELVLFLSFLAIGLIMVI